MLGQKSPVISIDESYSHDAGPTRPRNIAARNAIAVEPQDWSVMVDIQSLTS
jgi:hypothetical protein